MEVRTVVQEGGTLAALSTKAAIPENCEEDTRREVEVLGERELPTIAPNWVFDDSKARVLESVLESLKREREHGIALPQPPLCISLKPREPQGITVASKRLGACNPMPR